MLNYGADVRLALPLLRTTFVNILV